MYNTPVAPGSPRVLIVDDEPAICSALAQVLRRAGFDPVVALGAAEADILLSDSISAMLVDLRMAYVRGDVFYYSAAARFPILGQRTIFITGDISSDAERLIGHTGCPFLWKPFHNFALVEALRTILADTAGPPVVAV